MDKKLQLILDLISQYIQEKNISKKWIPGKDWVQYSGPYFDSSEYKRAIETFLNGWLVLGNEAMEFERLFPLLFGKQYGIVTNSGSSANLLMVASLLSKNLYNLPKSSGIIVPIAGFPTTLNPIIQHGFIPIFVDIELDTLNLDISQIEKAIHANEVLVKTRAIMFAHTLGNPPNMDLIMNIIKDKNLILLEDCCDALGSTYDNKPLGSFGDMASCSFYPAHHITMGEGGFVACKKKEQEKVVRSLREWGRACFCTGKKANLSKKGTCGCRYNNWLPSLPNEIFDHKYVYSEINGYNLKPIELQCSIGLEQLKKLPEIIRKRKENYQKLFNIFSSYEEFFHLPRKTKKSDPSWFAFPLTIRDGSPFKRSEICGFLEDNLIQTRNYFGGNLMLQPAYEQYAKNISSINSFKENFPNATKATTDTFFLGTSPVITEEQIQYIAEKIDKFMKNYITN